MTHGTCMADFQGAAESIKCYFYPRSSSFVTNYSRVGLCYSHQHMLKQVSGTPSEGSLVRVPKNLILHFSCCRGRHSGYQVGLMPGSDYDLQIHDIYTILSRKWPGPTVMGCQEWKQVLGMTIWWVIQCNVSWWKTDSAMAMICFVTAWFSTFVILEVPD